LVAGGDAAVDPVGGVELATTFGELLGGEHIRNVEQHNRISVAVPEA
jgi:hypothetical protein